MTPEFDNLLFAFVVVFLSFVHALEDFADVSHVKYVVRLQRCWQELINHLVVDVDCCLGHGFAHTLHLLEERLEFS